MHSLAHIATELEPERKDRQTTPAERLNISDWEERRRVLARLFYSDRLSHQYEGRDPEDLDLLIQAVIPQTRSIPVHYLPECYVVALEQRPPGDNFQIRGVELVNAWKVIQGRVEMESKGAYENKTRLITANARGACSRCFGTGFERMPDGSVRPNCPHDQWTDEDQLTAEENEAERRAFIQKQAEVMREALKAAKRPKPEEKASPEPAPGVWLKCSKCPRKVNVLYFEPGQVCNDLLNRGQGEGELKLCDGVLTA
jgi:hypothetical protein